MSILNNPVDVVCYGKKQHYNTRKEAIDFYLDCMYGSEGAEKERYTNIYLQLTNGTKDIVNDGFPEIKDKPQRKKYTVNDKEEILTLISRGVLSINSKELYDIGKCRLIIEDRDIIKALLNQKGWYAAQFLRKYIADDKELIMAACLGGTEKSDALVYAGMELRNDKEFVLEMIKQNCLNFTHAGERVTNDPEVVLAAINACIVQNSKYMDKIKGNIGTEVLVSLLEGTIHKQKNISDLENKISKATGKINDCKSNQKEEGIFDR